jgi:hypothetical protein
MSDSNIADPAAPRATLKLKVSARKSLDKPKAPLVPQVQGKSSNKPGEHWKEVSATRYRVSFAPRLDHGLDFAAVWKF